MGLVSRIDDHPQVRQNVLDMGLLEEPQSAANRVGNSARDELSLKHHAVIVVAVENGHVAQGSFLVPGLDDLLADEVRLLVDVGSRRHHR